MHSQQRGNSQLPLLAFSTMIYVPLWLILNWCTIFTDCDIGYIYSLTVQGVRETRLWRGKPLPKHRFICCCVLWQKIVVVQGSSYAPSRKALRTKRQTNWSCIFLNYFGQFLQYLTMPCTLWTNNSNSQSWTICLAYRQNNLKSIKCLITHMH